MEMPRTWSKDLPRIESKPMTRSKERPPSKEAPIPDDYDIALGWDGTSDIPPIESRGRDEKQGRDAIESRAESRSRSRDGLSHSVPELVDYYNFRSVVERPDKFPVPCLIFLEAV